MTLELQDVLTAIATVQVTAQTPAGLAALAATDEPPETLNQFPLFLNEEISSDYLAEESFGTSTPTNQLHQIDCHLVFAPVNTKYRIRQRRQWVQPILTAFRTTPDLGLGANCGVFVTNITHNRAIRVNGESYICSTYRLRVLVQA